MSDFNAGTWCDTVDALFWNFTGTHFEKLHQEKRLGFIGVQYAKMPTENKERYQKVAHDFLNILLGND
jgi:deoxyribodipyrimidine photolyase-like uncharacterized protein